MGRQQVLASQIGNNALFGMPVFPVGLHQADIFELDPLSAFGLNRAQIHDLSRS